MLCHWSWTINRQVKDYVDHHKFSGWFLFGFIPLVIRYEGMYRT